MFALFFIVLIIAIAVALAPIILGVIGTMLALIATFILWAIAGFPDNPSHPVKDPKGEAAVEQLEAWEREDAERALQHARDAAVRHVQRARRQVVRSLGEAQARDPEALRELPEGFEHDEP